MNLLQSQNRYIYIYSWFIRPGFFLIFSSFVRSFVPSFTYKKGLLFLLFFLWIFVHPYSLYSNQQQLVIIVKFFQSFYLPRMVGTFTLYVISIKKERTSTSKLLLFLLLLFQLLLFVVVRSVSYRIMCRDINKHTYTYRYYR